MPGYHIDHCQNGLSWIKYYNSYLQTTDYKPGKLELSPLDMQAICSMPFSWACNWRKANFEYNFLLLNINHLSLLQSSSWMPKTFHSFLFSYVPFNSLNKSPLLKIFSSAFPFSSFTCPSTLSTTSPSIFFFFSVSLPVFSKQKRNLYVWYKAFMAEKRRVGTLTPLIKIFS